MAAWQEKVIGKNAGQWDSMVLPLRDKLRAEMGEAAFAREFAAGKAMTVEDIVALAEEIVLPVSSSLAGSTAESRPARLTQREVEVLKLVAAGLTNAQAAEMLTVTPRTINAHLTSIYSKIGVTGRAAAVRFAVDHGLA